MFLQWNLNRIFCIYYRLLSLLNAMLSLEIAGQFPQPLSQRLHVQYDAVKDLENRMDKRHIPLKKQESEESDNESESDSDSENENEGENESESENESENENGAEDRKEMESISSISFWMILLVFVLCSAGSIFVILNYRDQFLPLEMDYSKSPFVVGMKKGALKTKQFITNQLDDLNERMKRARKMKAEMRREVEETLREKRENKEWKGGEEEGVMNASIEIKVDQNELVVEEMKAEAKEEQNEKEKKVDDVEIEVEVDIKENENRNEIEIEVKKDKKEIETACEVKEENESENITIENEVEVEVEGKVNDLEEENENEVEVKTNENEKDAREVGEMVTECEIKEEEKKNEDKEIEVDVIEVNENDIESECEVHDESENGNESESTSDVELESPSSVEENRIEDDFTAVDHEEQTENRDVSSSTTTMNELNEQHPDSTINDSKVSLDENPSIKPEDSSPSSIESFSINTTLKEEENESQEDTFGGQFLFSSILMKHLVEWGKSFSSSFFYHLFPCRNPFFNICKNNFLCLPCNLQD